MRKKHGRSSREEEHRGRTYWRVRCQKVRDAPLPPEVEQGSLVGPHLTAHIAYLCDVVRAHLTNLPAPSLSADNLRTGLGVHRSRRQTRIQAKDI